jgi:hypothetical protein
MNSNCRFLFSTKTANFFDFSGLPPENLSAPLDQYRGHPHCRSKLNLSLARFSGFGSHCAKLQKQPELRYVRAVARNVVDGGALARAAFSGRYGLLERRPAMWSRVSRVSPFPLLTVRGLR